MMSIAHELISSNGKDAQCRYCGTVVEIYSHRRSQTDTQRPENRQIPAFATLPQAGSHRDTTNEKQKFPGMREMACTESRLSK
jgi:hypothetical protein